MKIVFYAFPHAFDEIVIRTWPKGIQQKLFFLRDFQVMAMNGDKLASATSAWVMVQPSARRLVPATNVAAVMPDNSGKNEIAESLEKIKAPEDMPEILQVNAGYGTVDQIGHVNNTRYIEWICDCFPQSFYETNRLDWIQINYVNEVLSGEKISLRMKADGPDQSIYLMEGFNLNSGGRAFEARLHWLKREKK